MQFDLLVGGRQTFFDFEMLVALKRVEKSKFSFPKCKNFLIIVRHNKKPIQSYIPTNYTPRISPHSYIKWISQQSLIGDFPYTVISIINLAKNKKLIALKRHSSLLLSPKSKLKLHGVIFSSEKTKREKKSIKIS